MQQHRNELTDGADLINTKRSKQYAAIPILVFDKSLKHGSHSPVVQVDISSLIKIFASFNEMRGRKSKHSFYSLPKTLIA
jgi:hypothetical protein